MTTKGQFLTTAALAGRAPQAAASGRSWRALVAASFKRTVAWIRSTHERNRAIRELAELDDRMLADIGLSRCDIMYAAWHGRSVEPEDRVFRR